MKGLFNFIHSHKNLPHTTSNTEGLSEGKLTSEDLNKAIMSLYEDEHRSVPHKIKHNLSREKWKIFVSNFDNNNQPQNVKISLFGIPLIKDKAMSKDTFAFFDSDGKVLSIFKF